MKVKALPISIIAIIAALFVTGFAGAADFSGSWDTTWDSGTKVSRLVLTQKGNEITGVYSRKGGMVTGTIEGDVLTGKWKQNDGSAGSFKFTISPDGKSFKGKWRNQKQGEWEGEWNGVRP